MVKLIFTNKFIKSHGPYELVRAFYGDEEIKVNYQKVIDTTDADEDIIIVSKNDEIYSVYFKRNGEITDEERITYPVFFHKEKRFSRNNTVKYLIYKILKRNLQNCPSWGILTGIRPVKLVQQLIDQGIERKDIINILLEYYLLQPSKANLIMDISLSQKQILDAIDKNSYSLYIGIPFCPSKCSYCSFPTLVSGTNNDIMVSYIDSIVKELQYTIEIMDKWNINTIYIGGGTPTSLPIKLMEKLLGFLNNNFSGVNELTIEAGRPDTLNLEYLQLFRKYSVDRISINPQTMNNLTLRTIEREHSAKDIIDVYRLYKDNGIKTINMDIIIGLPGENSYDVENTLKELELLKPNNFTVHTLAIKKGSNMILDRDNLNVPKTSEIKEMLKMAHDFAYKNNLLPYYLYRQKQIMGNFENIGYSKKHNQCHYNISIMEEKETIIGVGMGSTTKFYNKTTNSIETIANYRSINEYMESFLPLISIKKEKINEIEDCWQ